MSNSYFQFQQFRIEQDRCGMKVSTDACIQGAWTPVHPGIHHVLDAGTGTGLLSLMLAQRNEYIYIDAVELDDNAAQQAKENITASAWRNRIKVLKADVRDYTTPHLYDMIICNPPFFQNSLLGPSEGRNLARHTLSLSYQDLLQSFEKLLQPQGYASVLLPAAEHLQWEDLLQKKGWYISKRLLIVPKDGAAHNRVVSLCSLTESTTEDENLVIRTKEGDYTEAFKYLLRPYYLQL